MARMDPVTYPTIQLARIDNPAEFDTYTLRFSVDAMEYLLAMYQIDIFSTPDPESLKGIKSIERACKVLCGAISDQAKIPYEEIRRRVDLLNMPAIGAAISAAISKVQAQPVTPNVPSTPIQ